MKHFLLLLVMALCASFAARAQYNIYKVEGQVSVIQGKESVEAKKGQSLKANDQLNISPGAKVEIYNSLTKEIYTSTKSGKTRVIDLMMAARQSAESTAGAVNSNIRLGAGAATNTRQYTEGSIKRAVLVADSVVCDSLEAEIIIQDSIQ